MEIAADKVNVDLERGTVIITGYDLSDIISEIGTEELLLAMDYADIMQFVAETEDDSEDSDYHNVMFGR
jgi:hypothetical protein